MSKKWFVAMAAAAAMTVSAGALAQAKVPSFYVGIDVGQTDIETVDDTEIGFRALGMFPVAPQFSLLVRLGFASLESDGGGDDTGLIFGFGVQYDVMSNLGLRLQWQRTTTDPEVDFLSVGAVFRF